jgi:hypothetical protein
VHERQQTHSAHTAASLRTTANASRGSNCREISQHWGNEPLTRKIRPFPLLQPELKMSQAVVCYVPVICTMKWCAMEEVGAARYDWWSDRRFEKSTTKFSVRPQPNCSYSHHLKVIIVIPLRPLQSRFCCRDVVPATAVVLLQRGSSTITQISIPKCGDVIKRTGRPVQKFPVEYQTLQF